MLARSGNCAGSHSSPGRWPGRRRRFWSDRPSGRAQRLRERAGRVPPQAFGDRAPAVSPSRRRAVRKEIASSGSTGSISHRGPGQKEPVRRTASSYSAGCGRSPPAAAPAPPGQGVDRGRCRASGVLVEAVEHGMIGFSRTKPHGRVLAVGAMLASRGIPRRVAGQPGVQVFGVRIPRGERQQHRHRLAGRRVGSSPRVSRIRQHRLPGAGSRAPPAGAGPAKLRHTSVRSP